jgi:hypothetical protein
MLSVINAPLALLCPAVCLASGLWLIRFLGRRVDYVLFWNIPLGMLLCLALGERHGSGKTLANAVVEPALAGGVICAMVLIFGARTAGDQRRHYVRAAALLVASVCVVVAVSCLVPPLAE